MKKICPYFDKPCIKERCLAFEKDKFLMYDNLNQSYPLYPTYGPVNTDTNYQPVCTSLSADYCRAFDIIIQKEKE